MANLAFSEQEASQKYLYLRMRSEIQDWAEGSWSTELESPLQFLAQELSIVLCSAQVCTQPSVVAQLHDYADHDVLIAWLKSSKLLHLSSSGRLYLQTLWQQEESIGHALMQLADLPIEASEKTAQGRAAYLWPEKFSEEQSSIAQQVIDDKANIAFLSGVSGSGKTTVMAHIIMATLQQGLALTRVKGTPRSNILIIVVAVANRALQRVKEVLDQEVAEAKSLPRKLASELADDTLLRYINVANLMRSNIIARELSQGKEVLVIVDEASMISFELYTYLLAQRASGKPSSSLQSHAMRMLFVGDGWQLPPIGEGNIFQQVTAQDKALESLRLPVYHLTRTFRQTEGDLQRFCGLLRNYNNSHEVIDWLRAHANDIQNDVYWHHNEHKNGNNTVQGQAHVLDARTLKQTWIRTRNIDIFDCQKIQLLCDSHSGRRGVHACNTELLEIAMQHKDAKIMQYRQKQLVVGMPIYIAKNQPSLDLVNGEIRPLELQDSHLGIVNGSGIFIKLALIELYHYGWAITIHKSQGSEYQNVYLSLQSKRMLSKQLLYTAATRAKKSLVIDASEEELLQALENTAVEDTDFLAHIDPHEFS